MNVLDTVLLNVIVNIQNDLAISQELRGKFFGRCLDLHDTIVDLLESRVWIEEVDYWWHQMEGYISLLNFSFGLSFLVTVI